MNKRAEIIAILKNRRGGVGVKTLARWVGITLPEAKKYVLDLQIDGIATVDNRGVLLTNNVINYRNKTYAITERGHVAIAKYEDNNGLNANR